MEKYPVRVGASVTLMGIMVIFICWAACGCMTPKKAVDYLKKKDLLDDTCAANFPVQEKFIKGDSVILVDTLWGMEYDTVIRVAKDTVYIIRTQPGKTITKTIRITDTVIKRDIAKESALSDERDKYIHELSISKALVTVLNSEINEMKEANRGKVRIPWWWLVILAVVVFAGARFKFIKLLNPFK